MIQILFLTKFLFQRQSFWFYLLYKQLQMDNEAFKKELEATQKEVAAGLQRDVKKINEEFSIADIKEETLWAALLDIFKSIFKCKK